MRLTVCISADGHTMPHLQGPAHCSSLVRFQLFDFPGHSRAAQTPAFYQDSRRAAASWVKKVGAGSCSFPSGRIYTV